jgi:uncharacterized UBP type Zn finger protein
MSEVCEHVQSADPAPTPRTPDGCAECLEVGSEWVTLRLCLACGHVGCCNDSPNKHASAHYDETKHPVVRSFEPGEDWWWCYEHEVGYELDDAPPAPSHT